MAKAVKRKLSGSSAGALGITVDAVESPGTTIHTAIAGETEGTYDEVWLWVYNSHTSDVVVSLEWGSSSLPRTRTIPFKSGLVPLIPGLPLQNGVTVKAFASIANVIVIDGFINSITD